VIRDSGPGIPPEHLDRIFEPFFTTRAAGEGTGLGLAVAQEIVHRHRGTLVAENLPAGEGGGAQLMIALPFDRRARERDPGRLLLVEDDTDLRRALARYLTRLGWAVEEAGDGPAALAAAARAPFDALVCDAGLPGMPGMVVCEQLVAGSAAPTRRCVLISGDTANADVIAFQERTGHAVLQKPFELEVLAAALGATEGPRGRGTEAR
jgi:CheY-like chemotaxis protein